MTYYAQDDDFDDYLPFDDEDYHEPVGSCEECEEDLFGDDWYIVDGDYLCGRCAWIANGCPEPGDDE